MSVKLSCDDCRILYNLPEELDKDRVFNYVMEKNTCKATGKGKALYMKCYVLVSAKGHIIDLKKEKSSSNIKYICIGLHRARRQFYDNGMATDLVVRARNSYRRTIKNSLRISDELRNKLDHKMTSEMFDTDFYCRSPIGDQREYLKHIKAILKHSGSVVVKAPPNTGKTYMALAMAQTFNMKTIVTCKDGNIISQWYNTMCEDIYNDKARRMKKGLPKRKYPKLLCAGSKPTLRSYIDTKDMKEIDIIFTTARCIDVIPNINDYEFMIIDELHDVCTEGAIKNFMLCTGIKYTIACSATPKMRNFEFILNNISDHIYAIKRKVPVQVLCVDMCIKIDTSNYKRELAATRTKSGSETHLAEYGRITRTIAHDKEVCNRIFETYQRHKTDEPKALIICCTIKQIDMLVRMFNKRLGKGTADSYYKGKKQFDGFAPIIIGTLGKVSTGHDQKTMGFAFDKIYNMLIFCQTTAKEDLLVQIVGRIQRSKEDIIKYIQIYEDVEVYDNHKKILEKFCKKEEHAYVEVKKSFKSYEVLYDKEKEGSAEDYIDIGNYSSGDDDDEVETSTPLKKEKKSDLALKKRKKAEEEEQQEDDDSDDDEEQDDDSDEDEDDSDEDEDDEDDSDEDDDDSDEDDEEDEDEEEDEDTYGYY